MTQFSKVPVTIATGFPGADGDILRAWGVESGPAENMMEFAHGWLCRAVAEDFIPVIEARRGGAS